MRVEACCQALLEHLLPDIDPQRQGLCVDVGVGTFAFYCELFARLGFTTVAVEPSPTDKLRTVCQQYPIRLVEQCLSDRVGTQTLHMGQFANLANSNFSSLAADWFGASSITRQVLTLDLATLLKQVAATQITAFKLDIEGWESVVIQQFAELPAERLPQMVMFEYGGGSSRNQGEKGWSPKFLTGTMDCLQTLQQRGYGFSIMVDYAAGTQPKVFDLQALDLAREAPFYPNGVYGNMLCFYQHQFSAERIQSICAPYGGGLANWLVSKLVS
ncbi:MULTISPECIES: FkbM family methyltransferase [Cyanophyceae]|uniref:FkbM family methyltransferase n=1 Tax=Leptolyngbya subtilissima DQ-A4 TaxID=2933933 RepID=A0ABV0K1M3_9CYAN|nr:FkbM family methyltransferase [Nodosilinea sp. FACHB-141]MBD2112499.1 FkbM family methyltransferase [Nodosilinea sp. FACHB-141]